MNCPTCGKPMPEHNYLDLVNDWDNLPKNWKKIYLCGYYCKEYSNNHGLPREFIHLKDGRLYGYNGGIFHLIRNTTPDPKRIGGYKVIQKWSVPPVEMKWKIPLTEVLHIGVQTCSVITVFQWRYLSKNTPPGDVPSVTVIINQLGMRIYRVIIIYIDGKDHHGDMWKLWQFASVILRKSSVERSGNEVSNLRKRNAIC